MMRYLTLVVLLAYSWPSGADAGYVMTYTPTSRPTSIPLRTVRPALRTPSQSWKAGLGTLRPYATAPRVAAQTVLRAGRPTAAAAGGANLAALLARRAANPARYASFNPRLGRVTQDATRLRAAASQDVLPLNGLLPDTPFVNYLRWRRSLNPARFDYYHPFLGPLLRQDQLIRERPVPTPPTPGGVIPPPVDEPTVPPSGGPTPPGTDPGTPPGTDPGTPPGTDPNTPPGVIQPPPAGGDPPGGGDPPPGVVDPPIPVPVPEPASWLLLALGAAGAAGLRARRRGRSPRDASTR